jgi:hypothetical protein
MKTSTPGKILLFVFMLGISTTYAQVSFTNSTVKLTNQNFHSGCTVAAADVNGDGMDDIIRLNQGTDLFIEYQQKDATFTTMHIADFGGGSGWSWGMCVADVDHNGYRDVIAGGYGSPDVTLMRIDQNGLLSTSVLPNSGFFLQNANFMDVNNDGWEDIFACDDNAESHIYMNDGTGNFSQSTIINFDVTSTDDSGNYGSVWSDFDNDGDVDLYIAKCRQSVSNPADGRRINVLFVNNGNGTYTSMAATYGIAIGAQTWTANFADIDNDGDMDLLCNNHDVPSQILENDGNGYFTDITATTGYTLSIQPIESVLEDFDNDGYVDILVTGSDYQFFHNNGNKTFTIIPSVFDANNMESFAIGDLNHDGKIDVYGSYASIYTNPTSVNDALWLNSSSNNNNFVTVHLEGTASTLGGLGARVEIYGAWGKQIREVHAGESYGTCNTADLHFGIGQSTAIDSVVVRWPSGNVDHVNSPAINQFITIKEATCVSPDNVISYTGPLVICVGQTITLTASAADSYLWSDGQTTQSINAAQSGDYSVTTAMNGNACSSTSKIVTLTVSPDETPQITAASDLSFCTGGSVMLSASPASSYLWSDGQTTQSISASATGNYTVTIQGMCQAWTSAAVSVVAYAAPVPTASDVYLPGPGSATITATGNNVSWYDASVGGNLLYNGLVYTTPVVTTDQVYYMEDAYVYGSQNVNTALPYHSGPAYSSQNTNAYLIFDVYQPCVLNKVKVYTDTPGDRIIELRDVNDNVMQSLTVNIPIDSSVITLNFSLTPGTYHLGTNTMQNTILLGYSSPRLMRNNVGVAYPYVLNNYLAITGSDQGSSYFYYFYDWEVYEPGFTCTSARSPVNVFVSNGISSVSGESIFTVYPSPANNALNIKTTQALESSTVVEICDVMGRILKSQTIKQLGAGQITTLDIHNMATGTYIVKVSNSEQYFTSEVTIIN